ncbi:MAG: LPS assembly protein LptD [Pseudomonadales bacterium]|nr:LPS assembly protein LptD [Pseudomonadales bacterium]
MLKGLSLIKLLLTVSLFLKVLLIKLTFFKVTLFKVTLFKIQQPIEVPQVIRLAYLRLSAAYSRVKFNRLSGKVSVLFILTSITTASLAETQPEQFVTTKRLNYQTAAEIDWRPAAELSEQQQAVLPYFCPGQYVERKVKSAADPQTINADADRGLYLEGQSMTLFGDAVLVQGTQEVRSPRIIQNDQTKITEIDGPLQIRDIGLLLTGEHATQDMANGSGTIDKATFLLHESNMRGNAAQITRQASGHIVLDVATLTRCEPNNNIWQLDSKTVRLNIPEGFGTAKNVTIRIKERPVAYFPYFRFPLNKQRLSGFLMPNIGYDSDGGTDINIPYYFNLAPNYDATYQFHSLWKRGFIHDGQFRFKSRRTLNEINAAFLSRDDVYDDRLLLDQTSSETDTTMLQPPEFEKQDRWLLNIKHQGGGSSRWKTSVNYSAVSDTDYLHDIGGDVNSSAVAQFLNPVDSSFTDNRTAVLDRIGQVQYRGEAWNTELTIHGFQTLDPEGTDQYTKLPELKTDWSQTLGALNLSLDLQYTFFDKDNTNVAGLDGIIGERAVAELELAWPLQAIWGYLEPGIGLIHRKYNLDDSPIASRANPEITTPRFSIDSGLYFDRFFKWNKIGIQQTLEPRLYFLYVEQDAQDDLPTFDAGASTPSYGALFRPNRFSGYDRLGDARHVSLGITTRFLSETTGAEFISISIGQTYYFKDREVIFQPKIADDPSSRESALFAEARLRFSNQLSISGAFEWEPDANRSNRGTLTLKYDNQDRKIINLSYIYISPDVEAANLLNKSEESDLSFILPLVSLKSRQQTNWSLIGKWNFGWDDNRTIESFFGIEYNDCCWKSRLIIRRFLKQPRNITRLIDDPEAAGEFIELTRFQTPSDVGIFFEFQLKGLATLGKRLDSLLDDGITGYREREDKIGL